MRKFIVNSSLLIVQSFLLLTITSYLLPITVHADVPIGDYFGFSGITSLGAGTSLLVPSVFSVAAVIVIIYFLLGAFKFLKAGGSKEEVAGAKAMIIHAIWGFIILMFAFLVVQFLLGKLFTQFGFNIIGTNP